MSTQSQSEDTPASQSGLARSACEGYIPAMPKTKKKDRSLPKNAKDRDNGRPIAQTADRYALYLASVQEPSHEVEFFHQAYRDAFGKKTKPRVLHEDFCGTAAVCYEWVKEGGDYRAIGVDIDREPLEWGKRNLAPKLKAEQLERLKLIRGDARECHHSDADILAAQNFSFWYFKTREEVLRYFQVTLTNLADKGVIVLDMMGGPESLEAGIEDVRSVKGSEYRFKYIWEQAKFCPITHDCSYFISFKFRDGSMLKRAFEYHWRYWSIPEVRELLLQAGYSRVNVYWEEPDDEGEGSGEFSIQQTTTQDPSWVTYVVGVK